MHFLLSPLFVCTQDMFVYIKNLWNLKYLIHVNNNIIFVTNLNDVKLWLMKIMRILRLRFKSTNWIVITLKCDVMKNLADRYVTSVQ